MDVIPKSRQLLRRENTQILQFWAQVLVLTETETWEGFFFCSKPQFLISKIEIKITISLIYCEDLMR